MAQVTVTIAGKTYRMACDDGQEEHLFGLAHRLDTIINDIRNVFGEIGDQRLTVMSAITVLDQLSENERKMKGLEAEVRSLRDMRDSLLERQDEATGRLADAVAAAAQRIEEIADRMGGSAGRRP
jgi:cell division protein ZapA